MFDAEATKRGLGAALLRKPTKLAKMVAGIAAQVDLPITVKIRTGVCPESHLSMCRLGTRQQLQELAEGTCLHHLPCLHASAR
jgi:tRNA-dihydrouridine synthase